MEIGPQSADSGPSELKSWENARASLKFVGRIPPTFTTPIRTLMIDHKRGEALSPASQFLCTRLFRSKTIKSKFYFSALTYHSERVSNLAYLSSIDLIRLYSSADLAAMIGVIFFFRKMWQKAHKKDSDAWEWIANNSARFAEVGGYVGYAVPNIGFSKSVFALTLRQLSMAVFLIQDPAWFNIYRAHLERTGLRPDTETERKRWGFSHLEVCGNMLQLLGFGVGVAQSLMSGLGAEHLPDLATAREALEFKLADVWGRALLETGKVPELVHLGQYYPFEKDLYRLLYQVNTLRDGGSQHRWLLRGPEEINPYATPQLYQEFLQEMQQAQVLEDFYREHLPQDVLEGLSPDDLSELSNTEQSTDESW